jgi:hypothetical protein
MAVTEREQGAIDRDRQEERRSGDELLAGQVSAPDARRGSRVPTRLRGRLPNHAEEGLKHDLAAELVDSNPSFRVEFPAQRHVLPLCDSETFIEWRRPPAGGGEAVRTDSDLISAYSERLAGATATHLNRSDQRMACVEL